METYQYYRPCYCKFDSDINGDIIRRGDILLYDVHNTGVYYIDTIDCLEDYEPDCLYELLTMNGDSIQYMNSEDFEEIFEVLDFEIRNVDRMFNKIMDGTVIM